jgi:hypothetical protein
MVPYREHGDLEARVALLEAENRRLRGVVDAHSATMPLVLAAGFCLIAMATAILTWLLR